MNTKKMFILLTCLATTIFFVCTSTAIAGAIKDRMLSRLPAINELKNKGEVGENNLGYLEKRNDSDSSQTLISEENADRKLVYTEIAQKSGATMELVGRRRAKQIAAKAEPGTWLQNDAGQWYKAELSR
jgi:hypothetical protein